MLSDRGTSFVNKVINKLCEDFQLKHRLTSPYRPQTNGMVERFNRTLGESIVKKNPQNDRILTILSNIRTTSDIASRIEDS